MTDRRVSSRSTSRGASTVPGALRTGFVVLGLACIAPLVRGGEPASLDLFPRRLALQASFGAQEAVAGDFDGDGIADVAIVSNTSFEPSRLVVHLGRADGGFEPSGTAVDTGDRLFRLAAGELLGDGTLHLVAGGSDGLWLLENVGAGAFLQTFLADSVDEELPSDVQLADMDGDGLLDLLSLDLSPHPGRVTLRRGLPGATPTFAPREVFVLAGNGLGNLLRVGDVDGDLDPDLAIGSQQGILWIENVAGALGPWRVIPMGLTDISEIELLDANSDGLADLAALSDGVLSVRRALGGALFGPILAQPTLDGWLRAGEFTGDGKPDLVVLHGATDTLALHRGRGDGQFGAALLSSYPVDDLHGLSVGRLQGGVDDLLVSEFYHVTVVRPGHDGLLPVPPTIVLASNSNHLDAGDLNGDGHADLLTSTASQDLAVRLGRGQGHFGPPKMTDGPATDIDELGLLDFDGDGLLDVGLIEVGGGTDGFGLLLGSGTGNFRPMVGVPLGAGIWTLALGDLDGDGRVDLVAGGGTTVRAVFGNAGGVLDEPATLTANAAPIRQISLGDVDADGFLDVLTTNNGSVAARNVSLLLSNGAGDWSAPPVTISTDWDARQPELGDMDGDGLLDVAVITDDGVNVHDRLVQFRGLGGGAFGAPALSPGWAFVSDTGCADLDGDGRHEVLATGQFGQGTLAVYHGLDGLPGDQIAGWDVGFDAHQLAVADLDGDGLVDVAVLDQTSPLSIRLVLNQGR